jgi:hypothetical protein
MIFASAIFNCWRFCIFWVNFRKELLIVFIAILKSWWVGKKNIKLLIILIFLIINYLKFIDFLKLYILYILTSRVCIIFDTIAHYIGRSLRIWLLYLKNIK